MAELGIVAERNARNGLSADDLAHALPGVHLEIKRTERLRLNDAWEQAARDARGRVPCVMHRRNRQPWMLTFRADDLPAIAAAYAAAMGRPVYPPDRGETCESEPPPPSA